MVDRRDSRDETFEKPGMPPPNLLFIYTDQQRPDSLAAYGNDLIQMPNLNRLAEESVVFDQAYVTQPVCQPSRASILTGLYPHTAGVNTGYIYNPLKEETRCLPEMIESSDHLYAHYGKWHLGDDVFAQHGFEDWISIEDLQHRVVYTEGRDTFKNCTYHDYLVKQGFEPDRVEEDGFESFSSGYCARLPEEHGKPAYLAREASRFIRENKARPFLLYMSIFEPHQPYFGPRDDQYDPAEITLPPNFENPPTEDQSLKARALYHLYNEQGFGERGYSNSGLTAEQDWRGLIARYWGLCSLVDTHVGTVLDTLEECGLVDNTIVVFTSDHGDLMGSHQLRGKGLMFEESVRVPLLIRLPGGTGKRVKGPVGHVDLMPTLLDLLDQPIPGHLQGKSLRPLMQQEGTSSADRDVFIEWEGPQPPEGFVPESMKGVVTEADIAASTSDPVRTIVAPEGWKFVCSPLGEHELYNLREDPIEVCNLARNPEYRSLQRDLTARIRAWQEETEDTADLSSAP